MNIYFGTAIKHLTNIDVLKSPCGRVFKNISGQLAYFEIHRPLLGFVLSVVMEFANLFFTAIAFAFITKPLPINERYITHMVTNPTRIITLIVSITIATFCFLDYCDITSNINKERKLQAQEIQLINALGGLQTFNRLPIIHDVEDENDLQNLEPSDVGHQPITRGFLPDGRFFIALQIQERLPHQQQPVITTLCTNIEKTRWKVLGHQKSAIGRGNFTQKITNLTHLVQRVHATHELV